MFKVGDKVRVVKKVEVSDDKSRHCCWDVEGEMECTLQQEGTIQHCPSRDKDSYQIEFDWGTWYYLEECLELVEDKKVETTDKSNPKAAIGATALPMTMLSPIARAMGALGKYNGMLKYGLSNFIGTEVRISVYLDAIERHLDAIKLGEDADPVDNVPHWGAIMANIDIIICAQAAGTLIDDRPRSDGQLEALRALKPLVAGLQEVHAGKTPHHYYMKNKDADSKDN